MWLYHEFINGVIFKRTMYEIINIKEEEFYEYKQTMYEIVSAFFRQEREKFFYEYIIFTLNGENEMGKYSPFSMSFLLSLSVPI